MERSSKSRTALACLLCLIVQAFTGRAQPVTNVASGGGCFHSLFLKSDGSLWGMGYNPFGQLGDGTTNNINYPEQLIASNVIAVSGGKHTLIIKSDGSLWATGNNFSGQLGDGTYGTAPAYGINHPELIVASDVTAVAAGNNHSLFLKSDGSLWGMGSNGSGELGNGTNNRANLPIQIVNGGVTAIAAGGGYSLFIKTNGSLWAMGANNYGQLGDGTYNSTNRPKQIVASNVVAIAAGYQHSMFLKSDGSLWGMGFNRFGQLGDGNYISTPPFGTNVPQKIVASNVTAVTAGYTHSLFLRNDGSLWGMGNLGPLSDDTSDQTNRPKQILSGGVIAIAAGFEHSLILKDDGSLWSTGYNEYGQLGNGTLNGTNQPQQILGAYNQISGQLLNGNMQLSFVGIAGGNYALDRSFSLSVPNWSPQVTNVANSIGALVFTNAPNATSNNFWRIRAVP
ncbi:MAG: chromosome condensation regulator [Verrucomicrobiota bacterium]